MAARRRDIIAEMESEYVVLWARGNGLLSAEQFERLLRIYASEFERMPHPILGTDAGETRDDLLAAQPVAAAS